MGARVSDKLWAIGFSRGLSSGDFRDFWRRGRIGGLSRVFA